MIALSEIGYDGPGRPVDGYGPGFFRIDGKVLTGAVLIAPEGARGWGGQGDLAPLLALRGRIDVLLLGTGRLIAHADPGLRAALDEAGIGVEPMASDAACRTYNMLLAEGRRVAAALLPV